MSLDHLLCVPITIEHPGLATDRYHQVLDDWTNTTTTTTTGWISQRTSAETTPGRDSVTTTLGLFLDADEDIGAGDRVIIEGETWAVDGTPIPARTPRGVHHLEVSLRRTTG